MVCTCDHKRLMVGRKYTELTLIRYTGTNKPLVYQWLGQLMGRPGRSSISPLPGNLQATKTHQDMNNCKPPVHLPQHARNKYIIALPSTTRWLTAANENKSTYVLMPRWE